MKNLHEKHLRAIEMLVQGSTPDEIAKDLGVVPTTISGWMIDKVFLRGWKKRRIEFAEEAVKFADLSERVPSVVAAILNSQSEQSRLRASEVYMRGLELEKAREEKEGVLRTPAEDLEEEERGDLIRKGILIGIGDWTYIQKTREMGYEDGIKYWDELTAQELYHAIDSKITLSLRCGKDSIWVGGKEFTIIDPKEQLERMEKGAKELLERVKAHLSASKEEIMEEVEAERVNPEPGTDREVKNGGDGKGEGDYLSK